MSENEKNVIDDSINEAESDVKEEKTSSTDLESDMDESSKKAVIAIGYFWILFLIPLIVLPKNKFAKFHVNQQIILFIVETIIGTAISLIGFIPEVGGIISGILGSVFGILCLIIMILQIVAVVNGDEKKVPVIGNITILK